MKLELETGPTVKNPDAAIISKSLAAARGFVILSQNKLTYIQASGSTKDGFWLEYQDGDTDKHFRCPDRLSLEQATRIFVSYVQTDDGWKASVPWVSASLNGDLPKSINRHLWLEIVFEFVGAVGGGVIGLVHLAHASGDKSGHPGVWAVIEMFGLFIIGGLIPRTVFRHIIGVRCPTPDCPGKAFPKGTRPIAYFCKSCGCSWLTEASETGRSFGPPR